MENNKNQLNYLWLDITERCNLECIHCYAESGPQKPRVGNMTTERWISLMKEAKTLGCNSIQFIGGEPITHPDFDQLLNEAVYLFDDIEIFSNLTALPSNIYSKIKKHNVSLATSFYSKEPEIHDAITGRNGSFQSTIKNLKKSISDNIKIRTSLILMDKNKHLKDESIEFIKTLGIEQIGIDEVRNIGRGDGTIESKNSINELCGMCWKGRLCVNASGDAYPCIMSKFLGVGNVLSDNLSDIINNELLKSVRTRIKSNTERRIIANCTPWTNCQPKGACNPTSPCSPGMICSPNGLCKVDQASTTPNEARS